MLQRLIDRTLAPLRRLQAALTIGRAMVEAYETALEDGEITGPELCALAEQALRLYEAASGRVLFVRPLSDGSGAP
jgi:hypothetical protein